MTAGEKAYGGALFELCAEEKIDAEMLEQLRALCALLEQQPDFLRLLATPSLPLEARLNAARDALEGNAHPYLCSFVRLLTEKKLIERLSGCAEEYRRRYYEAHNMEQVAAITAVPLTQEQVSQLQRRLEGATGKTVEVRNRVDPQLLGGVRLEFAGREIDGTVRSRLDGIRRELLQTIA